MTKTCAVEYRGRGFWAYDESLAILLYIAAAAAEQPPFDDDFPAEFVKDWRVLTFVGGNFSFLLDDLCADEFRRQRFIDLLTTCAEEVRQAGEFPASLVESWRSLGNRVIWRGGRGDGVAPAAPIVELALAMVQLVSGELPQPPKDHWWFVGTSRGITTIAMRGSRVTG